jgi:hypothetical protein
MSVDATTWVTILSQILLGGAAWRLANKVALRLDVTDKRVDEHNSRLGVLEMRAAQ